MRAPAIAIFTFFFGSILLIQLISWNGPTGAAVLSRCIDSDGETASVPGTLSVFGEGEKTYADACKTPTILLEKVCRKGVKTVEIKCNECVMNKDGIGYCTT